MSNVERDLSKLDPGFEFDTLRDIANSIFSTCFHLSRQRDVGAEQRRELDAIADEMAKIEQSFELVNDLPLILLKQEELRKLRAEIERKYMER